MPAVDKLTIINSALVRTGNDVLNVSDNSSDRWIVASSCYEDALPLLLESRDWNFQTAIVDLQRTGDSAYPGYADVYARPFDCLHLQNVWRTDLAALITPSPGYGAGRDMIRPPSLDYRVIGDQVHTVAPAGATAMYVQQPHGDLTPSPATFCEALRLHVMAGIFAGLNEDMAAAEVTLKLAREMVDEAAARRDQEEPRRAAFRSIFLERRRRSGYRFWG